MRELILHIGMHKTGTSSIQTTLQGFGSNGIRYANLRGRANHSIAMKDLFKNETQAARAARSPAKSAKAIRDETIATDKAFARELASDAETLIISAEDLVMLNTEEIAALIARAAEANRHCRVIAYARDPIGYPGSIWQQVVKKSGSTRDVLRTPSYSRQFQKWIDQVGKDNVTIRKFDPALFPNKSVVQDFAALCGIGPDDLKEKRVNESLSEGAIRLIWALNRSVPLTRERYKLFNARKRVVKIIGKSIGGPSFRTPVECLTLSPRLDEELEWLRTATGIDFGPEVEAVRDRAGTVDFQTELSRIEPEVVSALDDCLREHDVIFSKDLTPAQKMVLLYLQLLAPETTGPTSLVSRGMARIWRK